MSTKKANLILTTCSMAWGTSYIFMKLGIEGLSPLMLMALRTGITFLILVLIFVNYPLSKANGLPASQTS